MTTGETIMCDRYGCVTLPDLKTLDFSRRNFLKATGLTTLTMAVGPGMLGQALAADTTVKGTHGTGFCNLNFFLAHALQTAKDDGVILDFVNTPTFAEQVTFLGIGPGRSSLIPYTSFIALYDAGAPVKIVGRRRHRGLRYRLPARPRQRREAQGQDARRPSSSIRSR